MGQAKIRKIALSITVATVIALANFACSGSASTPSATPTAAPTQTPGDQYTSDALAAANRLKKEAASLLQDMISAQTSQADPKWPDVLNADADLIVSAANALKDLQAPAEHAADAQALNAAAERLSEGAKLLKESVQTQSPETGQQAFTALSDGQTQLEAAITALQ